MTPRHHPSEATILAYAAGALHEGLSLVVASHMAFCPECRDAVRGGEAIGIRPMMTLALTFDHRAVDGAEATRCVVRIKELLEGWDDAA